MLYDTRIYGGLDRMGCIHAWKVKVGGFVYERCQVMRKNENISCNYSTDFDFFLNICREGRYLV